jgi:hypothetical protein
MCLSSLKIETFDDKQIKVIAYELLIFFCILDKKNIFVNFSQFSSDIFYDTLQATIC